MHQNILTQHRFHSAPGPRASASMNRPMDFICRRPAVKNFPHPFAYVLYNFQTEHYCSFCLRCPPNSREKLRLCSQCRLARYCDRECQSRAWIQDHKKECTRLKASFPNLPLTDVLLLARIVEKLNFMRKNGDMHNWQQERRFDDLMTHETETREDPEKIARFEKIYEKTRRFLGEEMLGKEEFFLVFCRTWVNSHCIHAGVGTEIGMALDLGMCDCSEISRSTVSGKRRNALHYS